MEIHFEVPAEKRSGEYANQLRVGHTNHDFTLDFCQLQPPTKEGRRELLVVSRVVIPPTMVFEIIRTLNKNMDEFEKRFGEIQRPQP